MMRFFSRLGEPISHTAKGEDSRQEHLYDKMTVAHAPKLRFGYAGLL